MSTAVAQLGYNRLIDVINAQSSNDAKAVHLSLAKVLHRSMAIYDLLPMIPSNQTFSHIGARESYLPSPGSRRFNEYTKSSTGRSTPLTEGIAMFDDWFDIDATLYDIAADKAQFLADKIEQKIEGFKQKVGTGIWYGSTAADGQDILGLAARFKNTATYPNNDSSWKYNVWDGGGSGSDLTSLWAIEFGKEKVFGIYPSALPGGLFIENLGRVMLQDGSGGKMMSMVTHFAQNFGLFVQDERCVQRIANIETSGDSNTFDEMLLIAALNRLPNKGRAPGTAIIGNRTMETQMNQRATVAKTNAYYTQKSNGDVFGERLITYFQGVPFIGDDMILDTETQVTSAT